MGTQNPNCPPSLTISIYTPTIPSTTLAQAPHNNYTTPKHPFHLPSPPHYPSTHQPNNTQAPMVSLPGLPFFSGLLTNLNRRRVDGLCSDPHAQRIQISINAQIAAEGLRVQSYHELR
eukprot:NODE_7722_length_441_cov_68.721939_g6877_i0.p1 GENE.NODE_7722_length_441_cov_68.721939_g6877_i0~~NODE_7722_length_441_cov_68.721939_g6877_i0.p1  ORF type:complete len:126 (-),score=14.96 NODE_7722_length_441_cov_68.721939_g6877_i0:62-415(-)